MSIPRIFHHVWPGDDAMPEEVLTARQSWMDRHPEWEFRTWRPEDLSWLRNKVIFDRATSYAQKADIARFEVVFRYGGVYLDTDMECLRPLDQLLEGCEFFAAREPGGMVSISIFGGVSSHPILRETIDRLPAACLLRRGHPINFQTGPRLLDHTLRDGGWEGRDGVRIFPPAYFYPYDFGEPWRRDEEFPRAYAVHHWGYHWRDHEPVKVRVGDLIAARVGKGYPSARSLWREGKRRVAASARARGVRLARRLMGRAVKEFDRYHSSVRAIPWGPEQVLVGTPFNTRVLCPTDDISIGPELAMTGVYDQPFVDFLERRLRRGMAFVDVGANIGLFTVLAAARVGPGGRVVAYECNPRLLDFLRRNVRMNWFEDRVRVIPKAAHRDGERRTLLVPADQWGLGSLARQGGETDDGLLEYRVECQRLDEGVPDVSFIDLLKIDVEGGEAAVLDGASALLDGDKIGMIAMEFRADVFRETSSEEIEKRLTSLVQDRGATLHVPGDPKPISLDEALTVFHYTQLLLRFPHSSIHV